MQQQDSGAEMSPLLTVHTHRYSKSCYWCTHTSHRDMQTHQTCQKVLSTEPKNKTGLGARWNGCAFRCRDIPNKPKNRQRAAAPHADSPWNKSIFGATGGVMSVLSLIYAPLWPAISSHQSLDAALKKYFRVYQTTRVWKQDKETTKLRDAWRYF